jgi:hypothetical protein
MMMFITFNSAMLRAREGNGARTYGQPLHSERTLVCMAREFDLKNPTPPGAAHAT